MTRDEENLFELVLISHQYHKEHMTYSEIGKWHHKSDATISRRLTEAKDRGLIEDRTEIKVPAAYAERLREATLHTRISKKLEKELNGLGAKVRRVVVALGDLDPEHEIEDTAENGRPRGQRVARHAALLLAAHLRELTKKKTRAVRCGVNWGYSVHDVCSKFREFCVGSLEQAENLSFSGISGQFWLTAEHPAFWRQGFFSSSETNAQILANSFANDDGMVVHRLHVPVYLKSGIERMENAKETLSAFFGMDPGYAELYGFKPVYPSQSDADTFISQRRIADGSDPDRYGSITQHDVIVSGFSALNTEASLVRFADERVFNSDNIARLKKEEGIIGDLASHLIREDGTIPRDDSDAGRTNRRALTLWPEDLQDVANRAREPGARKANGDYGGVVLFCSGKDRARALYTILTKMRAANDVVIDTNLAYELYPLVGLKNDREEDFRRDPVEKSSPGAGGDETSSESASV